MDLGFSANRPRLTMLFARARRPRETVRGHRGSACGPGLTMRYAFAQGCRGSDRRCSMACDGTNMIINAGWRSLIQKEHQRGEEQPSYGGVPHSSHHHLANLAKLLRTPDAHLVLARKAGASRHRYRLHSTAWLMKQAPCGDVSTIIRTPLGTPFGAEIGGSVRVVS